MSIADLLKAEKEKKEKAILSPSSEIPDVRKTSPVSQIPGTQQIPDVLKIPPVLQEPDISSAPAMLQEPDSLKTPGIVKTTGAPKASDVNKPAYPLQKTPGAQHTPPISDTGVQGFTSINNHILDKVMRVLDPYEQVVLMRLLRLSHGFQKTYCKVSIPGLAKGCNFSESKVRKALNKLESLEFIKRVGIDYDNINKLERGIHFAILLPMPERIKTTPVLQIPGVSGTPIKDKDLKENNKKGKFADVSNINFNFENQYRALREFIDEDGLSIDEVLEKLSGYDLTDEQKEQLKNALISEQGS